MEPEGCWVRVSVSRGGAREGGGVSLLVRVVGVRMVIVAVG